MRSPLSTVSPNPHLPLLLRRFPNRPSPPQVRPTPPPPPQSLPPNLWTLPIPPPPLPPPQLWTSPLPSPPQNASPSINRVSTSATSLKRRPEEQSGRQEGINRPRKTGGVGPHAPNAFPEKLCFACRKQGHYANFCPERGFDWGKHIKDEEERKVP